MSRPAKLRVWHIGRHGEVAGGMTQVMNAYLSWAFERVSVEVIQSRDGSSGWRGFLLFLKALWQLMRLPNNGVVVVHLSQGGSFYREGTLLRLAHCKGLATVAQLHGSRFAEFCQQQPTLVRSVLSKADKVHVLSEETQTLVGTLVPAQRVVYIPNAVAIGPQQMKTKTVVFGGSVCLRKGIDLLTMAWQKLQPQDWQLKIAGPVNTAEWSAGPIPNAEYLGSVPHEQLLQLLDQAAIAVLPSRDEAMPLFILEALARGCCVISTNIGGIPKLLENDRGLLVAPGDQAALQQALHLALTDDERRQTIAAKGFACFVQQFSAAVIYPQLEQLWLDAFQLRANQLRAN